MRIARVIDHVDSHNLRLLAAILRVSWNLQRLERRAQHRPIALVEPLRRNANRALRRAPASTPHSNIRMLSVTASPPSPCRPPSPSPSSQVHRLPFARAAQMRQPRPTHQNPRGPSRKIDRCHQTPCGFAAINLVIRQLLAKRQRIGTLLVNVTGIRRQRCASS
jgi:hypothetical protein